MKSDKNQPQRDARRHLSLERKLAFVEFWRRLWLIVFTDLMFIALFLIVAVISCDRIAKSAVENGELGEYTAGYSVMESSGIQPGIEFYSHFKSPFDDQGIIRNMWLDEYASSHPVNSLRTLNYAVSIPLDAARYTLVIFRLGSVAGIFTNVFAVVMVFQIIGLVGDAFDIRRSIRKTLRPIYDLTLAAQSMNKSASPVLALPGAEELQLSGAIDTLNNITENNLSRRIILSDEREELRGLAEAINAMLDRLDAAYHSQLRFVSDASHELRTPISVIQGYTNLLDRWGKNDETTLQESIDAIKTEAANMQDLVEQLLFLARSDNQSIVLNVEAVDICALADEVLRETRMIDPSHEFKLKTIDSLTVRGDLQLLKQALRIFVDNAIKYTPNNGIITISTADEDDYAKLSVSDTGIGIPAVDLERVFDRFFRADESRARATGGTGLGLSIAKWIVDRHGGFVEIVSREDVGTRITVALPKLAL